jgi:hypothetical protein
MFYKKACHNGRFGKESKGRVRVVVIAFHLTHIRILFV